MQTQERKTERISVLKMKEKNVFVVKFASCGMDN